ncbi:MAG: ABC transporter permease [Thermomicrobiales bacterium]|nr:ABC transporter permease [Thermomicrobiales bacterium]MCO5222550.1 ABC transporter permease [Thermomicrobiales bacterium]
MSGTADQFDTPTPVVLGAGQDIDPPLGGEVAPLEALGASGEEWTRPHSNLWADAFRRLVRNRLALIGLVIVSTFVLIAILAPLLAPYGQSEVVDVRLTRYGPSWSWPMGLDKNGRDIFSRLMWGSRVSLMVGLASYLVILSIAIPFGSIAGFYGGFVDTILMRVVDVIYTIPQVLLVMLFVNARGPSLTNIILGIGLIGWTTEARLIRAQFLTLREQEYIKASRVAGAGGGHIIMRHLLPNSLTPIIVAATFGIPTAIFIEAALSFVGVGIQPPQASWGQMVGAASTPADIISTPHMLIFPVIAIGLVMLGFTFLGDGLRDALDPKGND